MPELTIRPLGPAETDLFFSYPFPRIPGWWETERDYAALLAATEYRPEHTWVAIRDGVVMARGVLVGGARGQVADGARLAGGGARTASGRAGNGAARHRA